MVAQRAELGKNFGVVLIPEGLVEFMHDVSALIAELNELMAQNINPADQADVIAHLTPESADVRRRRRSRRSRSRATRPGAYGQPMTPHPLAAAPRSCSPTSRRASAQSCWRSETHTATCR